MTDEMSELKSQAQAVELNQTKLKIFSEQIESHKRNEANMKQQLASTQQTNAQLMATLANAQEGIKALTLEKRGEGSDTQQLEMKVQQYEATIKEFRAMIETMKKGGEAMGAAVKEMVFTPETLNQFKADVEMFVKEIMAKVDETSRQQW